MSIDKESLKEEKDYLGSTEAWIENETRKIEKNNEELVEKISSLRKQSKGRYSEELETAEMLYNITHKNLMKYKDSKPQPYFGRIDFREARRENESFYIGKFGLGDMTTGDEIVIDWRSPIADLYYSGTFGEAYYVAPQGVINGELNLKRKFIIKNGGLIDAFDEGINEIILKSGSEDGSALIDEYLRINLEESSSTKLKDVVATIQKEQNDIIRTEKNTALIVQGSAGSGKTTIALHRLAYLLYKYKNRISGDDILVIAPNRIFLDYISDVLPDLGVEHVKQMTFEQLALEFLGIKSKVYTKDKKLADLMECDDDDRIKLISSSSRMKGSMGYKTIMDRYIRYLEKKDSEVDNIKVEDYVLFESKEIKRLFVKELNNLSLNSRKEEIKRYFKLKMPDKINSILDKIDFTFEYQIARLKKTMEDSTERRKKLIEIYDERDNRKEDIREKSKEAFENYFTVWNEGRIDNLYFELFNNEAIFNEITGGKIPEALLKYIKEDINTRHINGIIDSDDLGAMVYLKIKIEGLPEKYKFKHIVVDEAQDYSLFQIAAIRDMAQNNSFTIVGDVGQGIYYYKGIDDWNRLIESVFEGNGNYVRLTQSYRSTVEIIQLANKVLSKQKNSLKPALPVLRHGREPKIIKYEVEKDFVSRVDSIVDEVHNLSKRNVAIIGKNYDECKHIKDLLKKNSNHDWELIKDTDKTFKSDLIVIPSYMTKGLEFDCSIIFDCSSINYDESELSKKTLYVALTRALHFEYIFYRGNLSSLLLK